MSKISYKEAIADAKAIRDVALANAKLALEESFAPQLKSMLAAKLEEMEADENEESLEEIEGAEIQNESEDFNLDEELARIEGELEEATKSDEEVINESDDEELNEAKDDEEESKEDESEESEGEEGEESEGEEGEESEEDPELDLDNMTEGDLKDFIQSIIADMMETGELESIEDEEEFDSEIDPEIDIEGGEEGMENEFSIEDEEEAAADIMENSEELDEVKAELEEAKKELEEARKAIKETSTTLEEVNLVNAKLLYMNKIYKEKSLNESQKLKVLAAFDKAETVKEAKLVYESLNEGMPVNAPKRRPISEIRGSASRGTGAKTVIKENQEVLPFVNDKWLKIAGLK